MSYFKESKRKSTLESSLLAFGATACAFALLSGTAYADPEKKVEDKAATPIESVDETAKQAKDAVNDAVVVPMDLPQVEEKADDATQIEPEITETPAINVPQTTVEPPVWEAPATKDPAEYTAPIPGAALPALDTDQNCHEQEDGVLECICEGDKACAELTSSDICETGTSWRNDKGFGGCTKKAE